MLDHLGDADGGHGEQRSRVQLNRVLSGLRHLDASDEPARVFAGLAQVCVPALCDECLIEVTERDMNPYRIRRIRPGLVPIIPSGERSLLDGVPPIMVDGKADPFGVAVESEGPIVYARFGSSASGGTVYHGVMAFGWHSDYTPVRSDSALVGVLVDHAVALVHRERSVRTGQSRVGAGLSLPENQRIAAASGILMALYHLSPGQARQLLSRASEHNGRSVGDIADIVLRTGTLTSPESPLSAPVSPPAGATRAPQHPFLAQIVSADEAE